MKRSPEGARQSKWNQNNCGEKDLWTWNNCVLTLEWKTSGVAYGANESRDCDEVICCAG